jgi:hypothetical protein
LYPPPLPVGEALVVGAVVVVLVVGELIVDDPRDAGPPPGGAAVTTAGAMAIAPAAAKSVMVRVIGGILYAKRPPCSACLFRCEARLFITSAD